MFITGNTRTGKSTLARLMFLSAAAPRLVIDPADSSLTAVPDAVTFRDPARFPTDAETARFVPVDPADVDAYDEVYRRAFDHFPRYVWTDEPDQALPQNRYPRWANTLQVQGAKRQIGHLVCATRPRNVMRSAIALAAHVIVFHLPNPEDRRHIAELAGVDRQVVDGLILGLPRHGFLHIDTEAGTLTECPPLRL